MIVPQPSPGASCGVNRVLATSASSPLNAALVEVGTDVELELGSVVVGLAVEGGSFASAMLEPHPPAVGSATPGRDVNL